MKKFIFISLLLGLLSLSSYAQSGSDSVVKTVVPANFKSDGCSMFPDGDYRDCCVEHDKAYYSGGSWSQRWQADKRLFKCVARKDGWWHKPLAPLIWAGVRIGGVGFLPTSFRWGFGKKKCQRICRPPAAEEDIKKRGEDSKLTDKPASESGSVFDLKGQQL